ncbi:MAG: type II toxin-antitoxin system VapB family antitoxin [Burkholderiales bacterium]|nr:type II toxin-antitoxin system VapB family antitoxin [Burkholderiales bacterium]
MAKNRSARSTRTNVVLDDALVKEAMEAGGFRTKREAIEAGLRLLARQKHYEYIMSLQGKLRWKGDLDAMRRER